MAAETRRFSTSLNSSALQWWTTSIIGSKSNHFIVWRNFLQFSIQRPALVLQGDGTKIKDGSSSAPRTCPAPHRGTRAPLQGTVQRAGGLIDGRTLLLHLRHYRITDKKRNKKIYKLKKRKPFVRLVHRPPPRCSLPPRHWLANLYILRLFSLSSPFQVRCCSSSSSLLFIDLLGCAVNSGWLAVPPWTHSPVPTNLLRALAKKTTLLLPLPVPSLCRPPAVLSKAGTSFQPQHRIHVWSAFPPFHLLHRTGTSGSSNFKSVLLPLPWSFYLLSL